jgi:hypothetical protein
MGGFGSGRYPRWGVAKTTVEECRALDVNEFNHEGLLAPGTRGTSTWTRTRNGEEEEVASIGHRRSRSGLTTCSPAPSVGMATSDGVRRPRRRRMSGVGSRRPASTASATIMVGLRAQESVRISTTMLWSVSNRCSKRSRRTAGRNTSTLERFWVISTISSQTEAALGGPPPLVVSRPVVILATTPHPTKAPQ